MFPSCLPRHRLCDRLRRTRSIPTPTDTTPRDRHRRRRRRRTSIHRPIRHIHRRQRNAVRANTIHQIFRTLRIQRLSRRVALPRRRCRDGAGAQQWRSSGRRRIGDVFSGANVDGQDEGCG